MAVPARRAGGSEGLSALLPFPWFKRSNIIAYASGFCKYYFYFVCKDGEYAIIFERLNQGKGSLPFYRNLMREVKLMKEGIHPKYEQTTIRCACGAVIETGSTKKDIKVEICSKCHPFYTGKQKLVDTGGRVDRFNKKYGLK